MALVVEDGTGIATANSYVTAAEADTYFSDRGVADWNGATEAKEQALIRATDYVETRWNQKYKGKMEFPDTPQALGFPRLDLYDNQGTLVEGVPANLKTAIFQYALRALSASLFLEPAIDETGAVLTLKRTKVGPVEKEVEYAEGSSVSSIKPLASADLLIKRYVAQGGSNFR
jgi:hypothetical protein